MTVLDTALPARRRETPRHLVTRPTVSVIVPCYNYADYVAAAIGSALTQTGVEVDVIVVDDASTDDSAAIVAELARRDPRVRLLRHALNAGPVDTFNDGLALARGDYLVRLDADDLLTPGSLERSTALAETHPSVGLVYGHPLHFSGPTPPEARETPRRWTIWQGRTWLRERCRTGVNVITSPEVLMRRSVVDVVGGQRPLPHTHDMEMWLRIAAVSDVAYIEGADQAWHREHARSLSQSIDASTGDLRDRRDAFETLFAWSEGRVVGTAELRQLADRALADEARTRITHMYDHGKVDAERAARLRALAEEWGADSRAGAAEIARVRAEARGAGAAPRPWQLARAAGRRLANEIRIRRWHRHGVFHSDAGQR
ncbi:glycosyltransferase family 2 protein [Microbacterium sp. P05]|uniref:glycosyltransferase family 2 protein n=1 Tax=Microbacterium sp. P05 TaxID=3366948 RepID=UPI003744D8AE